MGSYEQCKTLWMGDIQHNWDETYVGSILAGAGETPVVKLIRDRITGFPAGYAFIEFSSPEAAKKVLEMYNGQLIPGTVNKIRLNWGSGGKRTEGEDHSLFVGDLGPDVTDELLHSAFASRFTSIRGAKIVLDQMSGLSKGFGFVRFGIKEEADQALQTMTGVVIGSKPIRVNAATDRRNKQQTSINAYGGVGDVDQSNSTVFVGGIDPSTGEEELKARFTPMGEVISVKIPTGRACGFIQFASRESAEKAILQMNGIQIGTTRVRCNWGKEQGRVDSTPVNSYYGQYSGYDQYYQQQGYYGNTYNGYQQYQNFGYQSYPSYQYQQTGYNTLGHSGQKPQASLPDFTKRPSVEKLNESYISQRVAKFKPPIASTTYSPFSNNPAANTAMQY